MADDVGLQGDVRARARRRWLIVAAACLLLGSYCGVYSMLRAGHAIMHYSNADHWHPEKRTAGHYVSASTYGAWDVVLDTLFWPLMRAEESCHGLADRRAGADRR